MIAHLTGKVIHKEDKYVVLSVSGVGYKVYTTLDTTIRTNIGEDKGFWIHHVIREDASDLYGFDTRDELSFFEKLITVSGIGPKTALGILNVTTVASLKKAISSGDTSHLVKVSGIGRKNAEKIVLELKGKVSEESEEGGSLKDEVDALDALKALGFSHGDARDALKEIGDASSTEDRVKKALKILGR
jgi:Holliday junction DNA helicase RuvA